MITTNVAMLLTAFSIQQTKRGGVISVRTDTFSSHETPVFVIQIQQSFTFDISKTSFTTTRRFTLNIN